MDAVELARLPHDVELGEELLARIGHQPGTAPGPKSAAKVSALRRMRIADR